MGLQPFGFIAGSYQSWSPYADAQTCMNLFPEVIESKPGGMSGGSTVAATLALYGTPGLTALLLLPKSPVRALLETNGRLFCVAGNGFYEIFYGSVSTSGTAATLLTGSPATFMNVSSGGKLVISGTTYTVSAVSGLTGVTLGSSAGTQVVNYVGYCLHGTVNSSLGPASIFSNGSQRMIIDVNNVYIDNDSGAPVGAVYQNGSGTVKTVGTAVTWISGSQFDSSNAIAGSIFTINGTGYSVSSLNSATSITLTSSAGTQDTAYSGTVNTSGTTVTWASGSTFDATLQAALASFAATGNVISITINSVVYTISSITDTTHLVLTSTAGTQTGVAYSLSIGVAYSATYPVTAASGAFLDGYFIVNPPGTAISGAFGNYYPGTRQINISALNNGLLWNPIDNAIKAGSPDNISTIFADHETLYLLGTETSEAWQNTGLAAFPLQRNQGGFIPDGCTAPASVVKLGTGIAWIGGDPRGAPVAVLATSFVPRRVSTSAVEAIWASYPMVSDATAYVDIQQGHSFWVINFGVANATWVYDLSTNLWHQRGWWNGSGNDRQRAGCHAYAFDSWPNLAPATASDALQGAHVVGDRSTGQLYTQSMGTYTDNGTQITRVRAARLPSGNGDDWSYLPLFRLIAENPGTATITAATNANPAVLTSASAPPFSGSITITGFTGNWAAANGTWTATYISATTFSIPVDSTAFGAIAGSPVFSINLNPSLDYSLDGGKNFIGARTAAPPLVQGAFGFWDWRRLGRHRDRVLRVTITAPVKVALIAGDADVE